MHLLQLESRAPEALVKLSQAKYTQWRSARKSGYAQVRVMSGSCHAGRPDLRRAMLLVLRQSPGVPGKQ